LTFTVRSDLAKEHIDTYVDNVLSTPKVTQSPLPASPSVRVPASPSVPRAGKGAELRAKLVVTDAHFEPLPLKIVAQYIRHARLSCHPTISLDMLDYLDVQVMTWRLSLLATIKHELSHRVLESVIRLAHAGARLRLEPEVTQEHIDVSDRGGHTRQ
jgi:DNA replicative helicase MCM subunit Mcm2 (Cdc46/Mcm family)